VTTKTFITKDTKLIFIGDLHGQVQKLDALLKHLKFDENPPQSITSNTKLVFIGDLIDNAPNANTNHVGLLTKVKRLVDDDLAYCIMGNHEFNAIGWATKHNENNTKQHQSFLNDVIEGSDDHIYWVNWFKTLPLYLDFDEIRAIHACWKETQIKQLNKYINSESKLNKECWQQAFDKSEPLYYLAETLLKGPEIELPHGSSFKDKTGTTRTQIRCKWWSEKAETYRDFAQVQPEVVFDIPDIKLPNEQIPEQFSQPVIVGHYTLNGVPSVLSHKVACVDYNAAKDDNPLVAYFWQGEKVLTERNFVYRNKMTEHKNLGI
jgi:hypothetical protein